MKNNPTDSKELRRALRFYFLFTMCGSSVAYSDFGTKGLIRALALYLIPLSIILIVSYIVDKIISRKK